ncbi:MAG: hypothetical protein ACFFCD_08510 [Promethearchaeota archaeon]
MIYTEAKEKIFAIWASEKALIISICLLHISAIFINPVRSIVYISLFNILPGYILIRFFLQLRTDKIRMILFSTALNIFAVPLALLLLGSIFGKLNVWISIASLDMILIIGLLFSRYLNRPIDYVGAPIKAEMLIMLGLLLLFAFCSNLLFSTLLIRVDQGVTFFYFDPIDHFWYWAIIQECVRSIPPQTPEYAGVVLTYPWFHMLLYAAIMQTGGINVILTTIIQNAVINTIFLALCFIFVFDKFKSQKAGLIAAYFLTFGIAVYWLIVAIGTGINPFFAQYQRTPGPQVFVRSLAIEALYSGFVRTPAYILAVLIIFFLHLYLTQKTRRYYIMAFVLLSTMPFYHPIIYLTIVFALCIFVLSMLVKRKYKESIFFSLQAITSIIPLGLYLGVFAPYLFDLAVGNPGGYFQIRPLVGLFVPLYTIQALLIYFGLCSVFGCIAFIKQIKKLSNLYLLLGAWIGSTVLFILFTHLYRGGNYFYYYSATIPVVFLGAMGLKETMNYINKKQNWIRHFSIALIIIVLFVSFIPFWQVWNTTANLESPQYSISEEELAAYNWIKTNTPSDAIFLTAPSLNGDPPSPVITYGARRVVIGNEIHVESQRLYYDGRYSDAIAIYTSKDITMISELLQKYNVDYVFVGPRERQHFSGDALQKFDENTPLFERVFENTTVKIYKISL